MYNNFNINVISFSASKLAPLFVEKKAQRPSAVMSIFDDSRYCVDKNKDKFN